MIVSDLALEFKHDREDLLFRDGTLGPKGAYRVGLGQPLMHSLIPHQEIGKKISPWLQYVGRKVGMEVAHRNRAGEASKDGFRFDYSQISIFMVPDNLRQVHTVSTIYFGCQQGLIVRIDFQRLRRASFEFLQLNLYECSTQAVKGTDNVLPKPRRGFRPQGSHWH